MHLPRSQHASPFHLCSSASIALCETVRDVNAAVGDVDVTRMAACARLMGAAWLKQAVKGSQNVEEWMFENMLYPAMDLIHLKI